MPNHSNVLTVRNAALLSGVSTQHIHRLVREGTLRAERRGHQFVLDYASWDAWVTSDRRVGRPPKAQA